MSSRQTKRWLPTNSRHWQRMRAQVLAEEPVCRCGCGQASTEVDHIDGRCETRHDYRRENLQGLAHDCHSAKTARENGSFGRAPNTTKRRGCDANGVPLDAKHHWRQ